MSGGMGDHEDADEFGGEDRGSMAKRIEALLAERRMSQTELARAANLTSAAISRYLSGERQPKGPILLSVANALGTSADYLLGKTPNPHPASKDTDLDQAVRLIARNARTMTAEEKERIAEILFSAKGGV